MSVLKFGLPPKCDFELPAPGAEEIASFRENGFLVVERLTSDEEIEWIRKIFDFVFSPEQAGRFGAPVDRTGTRGEDVPSNLSQAFHPEFRFPELLQTTHRRNAKRYAAALLGVEEASLTSWGHMIRKQPGGRAALWHQDHAYWDPEYDYCALGVWLPMHDVETEMGAMQFIPGSHERGLLPHRHDDAPQENVLTTVEPVDSSQAVACPLRRGGATFHHFQTLHYTAPNTTKKPRLAYPVEFQTKPFLRAEPRRMPWVRERRAATGDENPSVYIADGQVLPA
jgi:ectoine hydroxylase-related dioxygenase (phytanoyl-CoA dioxygenase family)